MHFIINDQIVQLRAPEGLWHPICLALCRDTQGYSLPQRVRIAARFVARAPTNDALCRYQPRDQLLRLSEDLQRREKLKPG